MSKTNQHLLDHSGESLVAGFNTPLPEQNRHEKNMSTLLQSPREENGEQVLVASGSSMNVIVDTSGLDPQQNSQMFPKLNLNQQSNMELDQSGKKSRPTKTIDMGEK